MPETGRAEGLQTGGEARCRAQRKSLPASTMPTLNNKEEKERGPVADVLAYHHDSPNCSILLDAHGCLTNSRPDRWTKFVLMKIPQQNLALVF